MPETVVDALDDPELSYAIEITDGGQITLESRKGDSIDLTADEAADAIDGYAGGVQIGDQLYAIPETYENLDIALQRRREYDLESHIVSVTEDHLQDAVDAAGA